MVEVVSELARLTDVEERDLNSVVCKTGKAGVVGVLGDVIVSGRGRLGFEDVVGLSDAGGAGHVVMVGVVGVVGVVLSEGDCNVGTPAKRSICDEDFGIATESEDLLLENEPLLRRAATSFAKGANHSKWANSAGM